METLVSNTWIEVVSMDDDKLVLKDTRHDGTLQIVCFNGIKPTNVLSEINSALQAGNLMLRFRYSNVFHYREGIDLSGNVQIMSVALVDPILEDCSLLNLYNYKAPVSVRYANFENWDCEEWTKPITLAYGMYSGNDIIGPDQEINMIQGCRVRR